MTSRTCLLALLGISIACGPLSGCRQEPRSEAKSATPSVERAPPSPPDADAMTGLKTWFPTLQGMYTDEKTGEKVLYVLAEDDLRGVDDPRKRQAETLLGMPIRLKVLPAPIEEQ